MRARDRSTAAPRRGSRGRRLRRAVLFLLAAGGAAWAGFGADPTQYVLARRGHLAAVAERELPAQGSLADTEVELSSSSGLRVELLLRRSTSDPPGRRPAVLILGGHRTGRRSAQLVLDTKGLVVAGMSYPSRLERVESLGDALEARRSLLDTPAAVMLCLDYLRAQPDVDPERVDLVGVSLGAPFVCSAGALDARFAGVWSVHGGASPFRLFEHGLRREIGLRPLRSAAAAGITLLAHGLQLAPEDWVGQISPRPFVMINAADDEAIPRRCVDLLYEAARDPKELIWIEGGHIDGRHPEQVRELCELVFDLMQRGRDEEGGSKPGGGH